ncbi:Wzz/FepE/Etk N-terminal domain-containing protein [uncultured Aquabacterium sp.]|jgi:capsule polysaccharide export protein KpsE/RkpR|uniref:Wzz/FepE/Etk N-terminal domain-containing protein n=1 Tax=uncultured Aquabacterium sp. TaxID=158753 RepID=UPI0026371938|nr:Wzz/FepE/Etk N-terminal domain-containing protein [uncultured Aquabacterium sp.]
MQEQRTTTNGSQGMGFWEVWSVLMEQRVWLIAVLVLGSLVTLSLLALYPRKYVSNTMVLPPQQSQAGISPMLSQLGALAGLSGLGSGSFKSSDELYVAFMKTRRVQDAIISRHSLMKVYEVSSIEAARRTLVKAVTIGLDKKSGLVSIEVADLDAKRAADMANSYVDTLRTLLGEIAVTEAQQRRVFLEEQVRKTKESLTNADNRFRDFQVRYGFQLSEALAEGGLRESTEVRARLAAVGVQLQTMSRFVTEQNPEYQRLQAEQSALARRLGHLERGLGSTDKQRPDLSAVDAYREVKLQEALLEAYIRQLEVAKLDESKESPLLQQVDVAVPSEHPSRPTRLLIASLGIFLTASLAVLAAFGVGLLQRRRRARHLAA